MRFATAAAIISELIEAQQQSQLGRALARWPRYERIALDEVGYVPLAEVGAELLFQVIAERAETATMIVTNDLAFFESTHVIPNASCAKRCSTGLPDCQIGFVYSQRKATHEILVLCSQATDVPLTAGFGSKSC